MTDREKLSRLIWEAYGFCVECPYGSGQYDADEKIADHLIANGVTFETDLQSRCNKAAEILRTIEWIGGGAKAKIEEAIGLILGDET